MTGRILAVMGTVSLAAACAHGAGAAAHRLADVDTEPVLVGCPAVAPEVTEDAWTRDVVVQFNVAADGSVVNAAAVAPERGWEDLATQAVAKVRSCRYAPATKDGRPVEVAGMRQWITMDARSQPSWRASGIRGN